MSGRRRRATSRPPDYDTIGEFYAEIRSSLTEYDRSAGVRGWPGGAERQLSPAVVELPGLRLVQSTDDALKAIDAIVEQGEGSSCGKADCHFSRFQAMRREWASLEAENPAFVPHLPAAHDPVMRKPAEGLERTWVTEPTAARLLDLGNALYGLTLTCLQHAYAPELASADRRALVDAALSMMHALGEFASRLASMPAQPGGSINAGLTFAVPRNLGAIAPAALAPLLTERVGEFLSAAEALGMFAVASKLREVERSLGVARVLEHGDKA